jgi:hypothetical protein
MVKETSTLLCVFGLSVAISAKTARLLTNALISLEIKVLFIIENLDLSKVTSDPCSLRNRVKSDTNRFFTDRDCLQNFHIGSANFAERFAVEVHRE